MKMLRDLVREYLNADRLVFFQDGNGGCDSAIAQYICSFERRQCFAAVRLLVDDQDHYLRIEVSSGLRIQEDVREQLATYAAQVNHGYRLGSWAIHPVNQELVFVVGGTFPTGGPSRETWRRMLATALHATDETYPAFIQLMFGKKTAADLLPPTSRPSTGDVDESVRQLLSRPVGGPEEAEPSAAASGVGAPIKRRRGRPRKSETAEAQSHEAAAQPPAPDRPRRGRPRKEAESVPQGTEASEQAPLEKRRRGRPRIHPLPE